MALTHVLLGQAYAPRLTVDVNEHMQGSEMTSHSGPDADAPSFSPTSPLSHMHAQVCTWLPSACLLCHTQSQSRQVLAPEAAQGAAGSCWTALAQW